MDLLAKTVGRARQRGQGDRHEVVGAVLDDTCGNLIQIASPGPG